MTLVIMEAVSIAAVAMPLEHRAPAWFGKSAPCAAQHRLAQSWTFHLFHAYKKEGALSELDVHQPARLNPK